MDITTLGYYILFKNEYFRFLDKTNINNKKELKTELEKIYNIKKKESGFTRILGQSATWEVIGIYMVWRSLHK